jgi:hypothetical protein
MCSGRAGWSGRRRWASAVRLRGLLLLLALWGMPAAAGESDAPQPRSLTLAEALLRLAAESDLEIVFSETLVRPEMRVEEPPAAADPMAVLGGLLEPHGLAIRRGPQGRLVVVRAPIVPGRIIGVVRDRLTGEPLPGASVRLSEARLETCSGDGGAFELPTVPPGSYTLEASYAGFAPERSANLRVSPGGTTEAELELSIVAVDEIVVTPSQVTVTRDEPIVALEMDADRLRDLPVAGSDFVRAAAQLPGAASNDFSARFSLRGGRPDEVLVRLDGLELFEPYHLKDFESAFSIVAPETIGRMDLISGGFPVSFGDRMSGVLDMTTREPGPRRQIYLGLSLLDGEIGGSGRFGDRGSWVGSVRQGVLNVVADLAESSEKPTFWDLFGKLGYDLSPGQSLTGRWLASDDHLHLAELEETSAERVATSYTSSYGWLRHDAVVDAALIFGTTLFVGRVDRDRRGQESTPQREFEVVDRRVLDIAGARHEGSWMISPDGLLQWGVSVRELESEYEYFKRASPAAGGGPAQSEVEIRDRFEGRQRGAFVTHRQRFADAVTVELGARVDENEILEERHLSPRLNLAWAIRRRGVLRAAWGRFYQSQRAYELQVEDGESDFFPDERSNQAVIGYEHGFGNGVWLRAEVQRRLITRPRIRYENLLDPVSRFPEVELDRVRVEPERSISESLELLLRRNRPSWSWWASYVTSRVEDRLDGRWVPRNLDQTHAALANLDLRLGEGWNLSVTGRYHTGWPYTPFRLESGEGGAPAGVVFGPLYSERFDDYARLDLRLARSWHRAARRVRLYLDVLNAANAANPRGFEISPGSGPAAGDVAVSEKVWLPRVAILGVRFEF